MANTWMSTRNSAASWVTRAGLLRRGIKDCTHEDDYAIDARLYEQLTAGKIPVLPDQQTKSNDHRRGCRRVPAETAA